MTRSPAAAPIARHVLPDSAAVDERGALSVGGCDLVELAAQYGTPLFVYDEAQLRARCRAAVAAFPDGAAYATKAFLCQAMARLAHDEGMHLDVGTAGEYFVARRAGVPAQRLVLHGNNKSLDELRTAVTDGVGRIVVDSFDELDRLDQLHRELGTRPQVLLRITPGVEAHTHEFIATGHDDTKFGFTLSTGAAARAVGRAGDSASIELVGLHAHIGSQVFSLDAIGDAVRIVGELARPFGLPELAIGGGLGVAYLSSERAPTIAEWGDAVRHACADAGVNARITAEPGRSIVAAAAVTLYTVGTIKELPNIRTYLSVDGGMSDNPRPVLYGSGYETFLPRAVDAPRPRRVRVVGKHCESGDVLVRDAHVPDDVRVGDILATPVTGAYGHSMGSNYQKVLRPAVVFVRDATARVVIRRETLDDLIRFDQ